MNPYQHTSEEEYMAFVERHCEGKDSLKLYRKSRERFVQTYPDLAQWFAAPLEERIGRTFGQGQGQYTHQASYEARQYLFYLAMRNYVTFDCGMAHCSAKDSSPSYACRNRSGHWCCTAYS